MVDTKILYIAGKGRSGGTLLANLLGQLPGFFNVGELNRLWDGGLVHNYKCGCGLPVGECPTWSEILPEADRILGSSPLVPLSAARIDHDQAEVVRWPRLVQLLRARPATRDHWPALDRYATATDAVYQSIVKITGARVIIDASRLPTEPVGLGLVPHTDVRIAHVVRDPRAVTYSWRRNKAWTDRGDGEQMPKFGPTFTTVSWLARNLVVERLRRRFPSVTIQYDDIARDPAGVLRRLGELMDEPVGDLDFLTSDTATVIPTHSVGGNPDRMTTGAVKIKPDEEWRREITGRDRFVTTMIAMPRLRRYGFPIWSSRSAPTAGLASGSGPTLRAE